MKKKGDVGKHKFCPICGKKLDTSDNFCTKCGYSFEVRNTKKRGIKLRNLIIVLILLLGGYFVLRISTGQPTFPTSFQDALSTLLP